VFCANEGTAPTAASGVDQLYADSTDHTWMATQNNYAGISSGVVFPVQINAVADFTAAGPTTLGANDYFVQCDRASAISLTLPTSGIPVGKTYVIKEIGAGACTITPSSGNVDGQSSVVISQLYTAFNFIWNGTQWYIF
jgi:hypothetical protein